MATSTTTGIQPVWLCWFTCLGCLSAYFWGHDDRLTAAFIGMVGAAGMAGYFLGAAVIVGFLLSVVVASPFATRLADAFGPAISDFLGTSGVYNQILAGGFGLMTVGFAAMLGVEIVWNRMLRGREAIREFNQTVGLTLGAIQGAFLALLLFGGMQVAAPHARSATLTHFNNVRSFEDVARHTTADAVIKIERSFDNSAVGPLVTRHNPFERIPALRRLQQRNSTLRDRTSDFATTVQ